MTTDFLVLHGRRSLQVSTNRLVIPPEDVGAFSSAVECAQALTSLLDHERTRVNNALAAAREEGLAQGRAEAEQKGAAAVADAVGRLAREAQAERAAARDAVSALALAVVSKLANSLGAHRVVPALIEQAVMELMPERAVRVRVSPLVYDAARQHLGQLGLAAEVRADESLDEFGCVIDSLHGQNVVSLDAQIAALGKALGVERALDIELA